MPRPTTHRQRVAAVGLFFCVGALALMALAELVIALFGGGR